MTGLYVATRIITFFGTELRALWELIVCRIKKIPAEDVRSFKSSELCGHVEHELTKGLSQSFMMCVLPFALNFILGCCAVLFGSFRMFYIGDFKSLIAYISFWVGFSLLANCAPSFEDALAFRDGFSACKSKVKKVLAAPFFAVSYASAFLERYCITFVLALIFSAAFPYIFSLLFPLFDLFTKAV